MEFDAPRGRGERARLTSTHRGARWGSMNPRGSLCHSAGPECSRETRSGAQGRNRTADTGIFNPQAVPSNARAFAGSAPNQVPPRYQSSHGGRYPARGRIDTLNTATVYPSHCAYGIPEVPAYEGPLPSRFVAWPNRKRAAEGDGLHMFVDDTRFEPVWTSPDRYRRHFEGRVVCSADFSSYTDWPLAACLWNTYRSRWLARTMYELGARVIPAVSWAGPETFSFAFAGLARGGSVAISAYGATRFEAAFRAGCEAMVVAIAPSRVVVVGGVLPEWLARCVDGAGVGVGGAFPARLVGRVHYFPANTIADRRAA